jgi:pimeloyl-ACP methyl ester carboxylesterase
VTRLAQPPGKVNDLTGVTLVGWSHGGMVIAGVAERVPERLAQVVFFDAVVPADGQSFYDADRDVAAGRGALRRPVGGPRLPE